MKRPFSLKSLFITGILVFLGLVFFTSGMAKLYHGMFPGVIGPAWLEDALTQYGLGFYAKFIAYSQVTVGLLLLTGRFATLGAVMLFPIILNIWIVTISLQWKGTPYINFFLLCLNIILLISDYDKLKYIIAEHKEDLPKTVPQRNLKLDILWLAALGSIIISTLTVDVSPVTSYILVGMGMIGFIGVWIRSRKDLPKTI